MKLIVGLGNPGNQYEHTRHNMGFDVLDMFANSLGIDIDKKDFKSLYIKTKYLGEDLFLVKPQTYMNLSGDSVSLFVNYFKINLKDIIVVHDDMDIPVGQIKLKKNGSSAGHNGLKSIINSLNSEDFKRIKVGIGKPLINSIDFVLSKPTKDESLQIENAKKQAVDAIKITIKESFEKAMNIYNTREE